MPNTDERRAKAIVIETFPNTDPIKLEQKWAKFLKEKTREGIPQAISDEFIRRWGEF
jgi:hypothetical protein